MKVLVILEIDDEHQFSQVNELYDRLHGFNAKLVPVPERKEMTDIVLKGHTGELLEARYDGFNACLEQILGEEE